MTSLIFGQPRDIMDGRSDYFWWTVHRRGSLLQSARECLGNRVDDAQCVGGPADT